MERTRIVHYTHSRTPLILSPSTPTPQRLASASSMSSLVSDVDDDKAPLASIDIDFPSTPRRSSKSSDQNGNRSSSTGRLLDDSKLGTSEYTALLCQDLPVAEVRKDASTNNYDDVRKERSGSDITPPLSGNSPNASMDAAMRRHTLGSWSRSRRKPQSANQTSSSSPRNSTTLPHRGSDSSSSSSDTLVKSRRRYTWLSSKQNVPQGPTVTRPQTLDGVGNDIADYVNHNTPDSMSPVHKPHPVIKNPLSPLRQQNGINGDHTPALDSNAPTESSTFPRTGKTKVSRPVDQNNYSIDSHRKEHRHSSNENADERRNGTTHDRCNGDSNSTLNGTPPSPKKSPSIKSPRREHPSNKDDLVNSSSQGSSDPSSSPKSDPKSGSPTNYNWRRDPRRRPCNFVNAFNLSPPQSPPEPSPGTRDPPSIADNERDRVNSKVERSPSSSSKKQHNKKTPSPPSTKRHDTSFTSKISSIFGSEKCNNKLSGSSDSSTNSYVSYDGPDNDLTFEDKTPVNEIDPPLLTQCLSDARNDKNNAFTTDSPYENGKDDNANSVSQSRVSPTKQNHTVSDDSKVGYRDCLVRNSIKRVPTDRAAHNHRHSVYSNPNFFKSCGQKNPSLSKKSKSVSACSEEISDNSIENILKSPRTRNSFKIAVGSNWDDVFPAAESLPKLPDISEDKALSPKRVIRKQATTSEEDVFISCKDLITDRTKGRETCIDEPGDVSSDRNHLDVSSNHAKKVPLTHSTLIQEGQECEDYDTLTRRIKRNSMRLATASLTDLTYAVDDIDISNDNTFDNSTDSATCPDPTPPKQNGILDEKTQTSRHASPLHTRSNLSRTGSLLSSKNSSSFGSYYSCQSIDANVYKNSPSSNAWHRKELRSRLDSPLVNRLHNYENKMDTSFPSSTRTSSPVSIASSGRSGHRQRPAYFWTRQAPYPRLLYARSNSVASSRGSSGYRASSPQPSITSSIHTNISNNSNTKDNDVNVKKDNDNAEHSKTNLHPDDSKQQDQRPPPNSSSRPIDRRSMTLPITNPYYTLSSDNYNNYTPYTPDLSPSSVLESPNSNAVRSPPSLGRPRRKQYAGFDCQPLPMDSFMSDSSSVYTGVSCSSRATDMTGQPDNASQFDESFMSEDIRSCFEDESRGDISYDGSEMLQPSSLVSDITITHDLELDEENESKRGSVHSTSTTKQENGDSSSAEDSNNKCRDDSTSIHNCSDEFIEHHSDHIGIVRHEKQFGSEYDALFRLYKTDDSFRTPSYSLYSQNGKAFSSSCLLRAQLYSKRKFLSTRDIFDLLRDSDKTRPDATVSLSSLERHAHKVCEAILCCDEMDQGYINNDTHSLV